MSDIPKISAVIIAYQEQDWIRDCLLSVKGLVDDIVVVHDGQPTDRTLDIAAEFGARCFIRPHIGYMEKNMVFGVEQCRNDWVLSIDSDERVSHELAKEIPGLVDQSTYNGYYIPFKNYFLGHQLRMKPEQYRHIRLFKKSATTIDDHIHKAIHIDGDTGEAKAPLIHYSYKSITSVVEKFNRYTDVEAKTQFDLGYRTNALKIVLSPISPFLRRQFLLGGWRDGAAGLILNLLFGYYYLLIQMKVWAKQSR